MKLIIDRFEGKFAVCEKEDKSMVDVEKDKIPKEAKAGDVLVYKDGTYLINKEGTEERKERIEKLMEDMWE